MRFHRKCFFDSTKYNMFISPIFVNGKIFPILNCSFFNHIKKVIMVKRYNNYNVHTLHSRPGIHTTTYKKQGELMRGIMYFKLQKVP